MDQENDVIRKEMIQLVDLLLRHPQHVQPTKGWLESRIDRLNNTKDDSDYLKDVSSLAKLMADETFIVAAVMRNSGLSKADMEKIKSYDGDAVKQLFQVMIEATVGLHIPQEMLSKQVANMVIDRRAEQVGNRLKKVRMSKGVAPNGKVLWSEIGPCGLVLEGDRVVKIVHRYTNTEQVVPEEVSLTKQFVIESGHSAMKAKAVRGMTKYLLHEFFPSDAGPNDKLHKPITGKSAILQNFVTEVQDCLAEAARGANQGKEKVDLDDFGVERKRQKNEANAKKAREALARRAVETSGKRRIKIA